MFNYAPEWINVHGVVAAATIAVYAGLSNFRFPSWWRLRHPKLRPLKDGECILAVSVRVLSPTHTMRYNFRPTSGNGSIVRCNRKTTISRSMNLSLSPSLSLSRSLSVSRHADLSAQTNMFVHLYVVTSNYHVHTYLFRNIFIAWT